MNASSGSGEWPRVKTWVLAFVMRCIAQTYAAPEADGTKIGTTRRSADFPATGRIRCGEQVCRVAGFQTSGPLEVAFNSAQPSTRHVSGLALRFLRLKAIRRDKNVDSSATIRYARDVAR